MEGEPKEGGQKLKSLLCGHVQFFYELGSLLRAGGWSWERQRGMQRGGGHSRLLLEVDK